MYIHVLMAFMYYTDEYNTIHYIKFTSMAYFSEKFFEGDSDKSITKKRDFFLKIAELIWVLPSSNWQFIELTVQI